MSYEMLLLAIVVVTALAFDFTNGFHDTANAMATSIATKALKPKTAVALSAVLNLVGAFLSFAVAGAIAKGLVEPGAVTLTVVLAGLCGGIIWNLLTWLLGLPSSSSHALFGGVIGAVIAHAGVNGVIWTGLVQKVVVPALLSPVIALAVAAAGTWLAYRITARTPEETRSAGFRLGQIGSASLLSLAHGTNDAQKTMGIIFLALLTTGLASPSDTQPPWWVIIACAVAIAAGTYMGGWRIIRTLGKGLVEVTPPQGLAAEISSASVILVSSHYGLSLSTTHVATGSVLGSGVGRKGATVRWGVAGRMGIAWLVTMPAAGIVGAICTLIAGLGIAGPLVVFGLLVATTGVIVARSRRNRIDHTNVIDDWDGEGPVGSTGSTGKAEADGLVEPARTTVGG